MSRDINERRLRGEIQTGDDETLVGEIPPSYMPGQRAIEDRRTARRVADYIQTHKLSLSLVTFGGIALLTGTAIGVVKHILDEKADSPKQK